MKYTEPHSEKLYYFEELDEQAQYNVIATECEFLLTDDINSMMEYEVDFYFPTSEIEPQYDFSACQGSGFNLYGTFCLNELVYFATGYYLDDDAADDCRCHIPANRRYTYCKWDQSEYGDIVAQKLYEYYYNYALPAVFNESDVHRIDEQAQELASTICEKMGDLCSRLYFLGEQIIEDYGTQEHNEDSLFTESGRFYCYTWDTDAYTDETETAA